jgi:hypothetical protein
MYLEQGLEILVKEWVELKTNGETILSLAELLKKLGGENWSGITPELTPGEVAELIERDMKRLGVSGKADRFMGRFRTEDELLTETSLYDLICDFAVPT